MSSQEAVLGMIINSPTLFVDAVSSGVSKECFEKQSHREIWLGIEELYKIRQDFDAGMLFERLKSHGLEISNLISFAPIAQNFDVHCTVVVNKYKRRIAAEEIRQISVQLFNSDPMGDVEDVKTKLQNLIEILDGSATPYKTLFTRSESVNRTIEFMETKLAGVSVGLDMPLKTLQLNFNGWKRQRLYFIAAQTGVGKTTFALNAASLLAKQGKKVLFFSNEMEDIDLVEKEVSLRTGLRGDQLENPKFNMNDRDQDKFMSAMREMGNEEVYTELEAGVELEKFSSICKKMVRKHKIDIVFLDYIQQMQASNKKFATTNDKMTHIVHEIKQLARKLDIPIVALAQLNRESDKGQTPFMPKLSHIRDSSSIAFYADGVVILHKGKVDSTSADGYWVGIEKNRKGKNRVCIQVNADLETSKFWE